MYKTFLLAFLVILLTACDTYTPQPTLFPIPTAVLPTAFTPIPLPTQTSLPVKPTFTPVPATPTATVTSHIPTPLPTLINANPNLPLNPSGPWLAYRAWPSGFEDQVGEVAVVNPDGSGRRKLADHVWSLITSPASPYLAMLIQPTEYQGVVTGANTLEIIRLPDLIRKAIALLSSPAIQNFDYHQLNTRQIQDKDSAIHVIAWAVSHEPPAWSPNGRYLAFTAAIDGPTADLYVYDTQSDQIRRLSDGLEMATQPEWSPDSQWIVHRGINGYGLGCTETGVWAAAVDGSVVKWLNPGECFQITRWIALHIFESFQPPNGGGYDGNTYRGAVKQVDIAAGTSTFLRKQPVDQPPSVVDCLTKAPVNQPNLKINSYRSDAPNGKWFVVATGTLRLYTSDRTLLREFENLNQFNGWLPDSSGILFTTVGKQPGHRSIQYYQPAEQILKTFEDFLPVPSVYPDRAIWSSAPSSFFLMSAQTSELFYANPLLDQFVRVEESLGVLYKQDFFWVGAESQASSYPWLPCFPGNP